MKKVHILIVDDEQDVIATMKMILELANFDISVAFNGHEALNIINANLDINPVDIIITDLSMPEMSGSELIEEIQKKDWDLAIIVVSAYRTRQKMKQLAQNGIATFIDKPFKMHELLNKVNELVEKKICSATKLFEN